MKGLFFVLSGGQKWGPQFDPFANGTLGPKVTSPNQGGGVFNFLSANTGPKVSNPAPAFSTPAYGINTKHRPGTWTQTNSQWLALNDEEKAAAMSLMEADGMRIDDAKNVAAAMVNRAAKNGHSLGQDVSSRAYQPTFEPTQEARLGKILQSEQYQKVRSFISDYQSGNVPDPTSGATHFLVHPQVMLNLEAREPNKYRSWRGWTGFDQGSMTYAHQTITDRSHAFLAPEGRFSVGPKATKEQATVVQSESYNPDGTLRTKLLYDRLQPDPRYEEDRYGN